MNFRVTSAISSFRPRSQPEAEQFAIWDILDRLAPLLAFAALLLIWELAVRLFAIPAFILPAPTEIMSAASNLPGSTWLENTLATLRVALLGFALAIVVSIPLAIAFTRSRLLTRTLLPLLVVVKSMPVVAIAPIIIVVCGSGDLPRVLITFLISFFPIVVSTITGLSLVPIELIELSRSLKARPGGEMLDIRLPSALPHIFSALKVASTLVVTGAVVAEFVAAEKGLGFMVMFSTSMFKVSTAFGALTVLVSASLALFYGIDAIQRFVFPWSLPKEA